MKELKLETEGQGSIDLSVDRSNKLRIRITDGFGDSANIRLNKSQVEAVKTWIHKEVK